MSILYRFFLLILLVSAAAPALAQEKAPLAASSISLPDFLSRVHSTVRLEEGDSVMLHSLVARGLVTDSRIPLTKCGTGVLGYAHELSSHTKDTWQAKIQATPPGFNTKILSPSGRFTVHYWAGDSNGAAVAKEEYVNTIARYADEAYQLEIDELGYVKPPFSNADSTYHIYLLQLGASGVYGYTDEVNFGELTQTLSGVRRVRTFMVMDNDFLDSVYVTKGLPGARITLFHEFHHMVQFGSYGRGAKIEDKNFQEMTSTWMESLSDPTTEDYIQYISSYIRKLTFSFDKAQGGGYGQSIWLEYLASKLGQNIVREVWEQYRDVEADQLEDFAQVLLKNGSSFACEYAEFGRELFFTGWRTKTHSRFSGASKFPIEDLEADSLAKGEAYTAQTFQASLHLLWTKIGAQDVVLAIARDTALVIADITSATIDATDRYSVSYSDPSHFCESFGRIPTDAEVFPQPFVLSKENSMGVFIRVAGNTQPHLVEVKIHSISMNEIIKLNGPFEGRAGGYAVNWNGLDAAGKPVPSGIYLYTAEADGEQRSGKIVVIRK